MAVEDPVTAQRRELCVDVDQAMRRGSVVSDDFLARMKWKVWLMKGEATVLRSVVSGLMDAVFNFSESELTPEEKSQLIKNLAKKSIIDLLVAMQDLEKKIRLEQKYLRLDSLSDLERNESEAKIAGFRSGQSQYSADIKLFIPFLSLENISILGAELLEQDFNLQFGWLMESFETTGDITKTTVSEEISHRVMQGLEVLDEDEISKRLQVLISLYQVEGVPVNAESIETLKALLPGSEADKQRRFLDLIEDLVRDFLILEKPLNRGALASLIPGEQLREDIIFSAKVNLSAKETLLSGGPLEKISGFIQDEGRSETAKACALSEGKYIESNITRHLELERYLEFLRDCDVNPRLVESQVAAKFKEELRSRLVIIGLLDSMHESPEKVRLIFSQANRLNRLDPEALTPQEMAKNIYQLERVLSHKKYQPRKWGNHSSDFMANAERIESLRTLYEQAFPGIPLVPQEEILRPKEITAAGAQDVLTFKQMLAQTAAPAAMTPTQPERRERGGTDDLMPATRT
jgi:hypothetical protein